RLAVVPRYRAGQEAHLHSTRRGTGVVEDRIQTRFDEVLHRLQRLVVHAVKGADRDDAGVFRVQNVGFDFHLGAQDLGQVVGALRRRVNLVFAAQAETAEDAGLGRGLPLLDHARRADVLDHERYWFRRLQQAIRLVTVETLHFGKFEFVGVLGAIHL